MKIFDNYYALDKGGKTAFIAGTTRIKTKRLDKKLVNSHRSYSMEYYFYKGDDQIRICKPFYLLHSQN